MSTSEEMYKLFCSDTKSKFVVFDQVPGKKPIDQNECEFIATGEAYHPALIGTAVVKDYPYKRSFNKV